jgi:hypothetical protein
MLALLMGLLTAAAVGYEPPGHIADGAAWVVLAAAVLTATTYLMRQARRAFRFLEQIHDLTTRELEHKGQPQDDATMKDDLHGIAVSLGRLQRRVDQATAQIKGNSRRLDQVEGDLRAIYDPTGRRTRQQHDRREDI